MNTYDKRVTQAIRNGTLNPDYKRPYNGHVFVVSFVLQYAIWGYLLYEDWHRALSVWIIAFIGAVVISPVLEGIGWVLTWILGPILMPLVWVLMGLCWIADVTVGRSMQVRRLTSVDEREFFSMRRRQRIADVTSSVLEPIGWVLAWIRWLIFKPFVWVLMALSWFLSVAMPNLSLRLNRIARIRWPLWAKIVLLPILAIPVGSLLGGLVFGMPVFYKNQMFMDAGSALFASGAFVFVGGFFASAPTNARYVSILLVLSFLITALNVIGYVKGVQDFIDQTPLHMVIINTYSILGALNAWYFWCFGGLLLRMTITRATVMDVVTACPGTYTVLLGIALYIVGRVVGEANGSSPWSLTGGYVVGLGLAILIITYISISLLRIMLKDAGKHDETAQENTPNSVEVSQ